MHTKSSLFKIRKLLLRKEFTKTEILGKIENEFNRHAVFQNKILQMSKPQLV
jgi:hypothetical protein